MEQLQLAGMPRRLYSCTPTRLGTWLDCPRRYRMTYLDRPQPGKGPPWAHNSLGASVHNALAGWWRLPRERRTVTAAGALVSSGWLGDGFASDAQSAQYRDHCRALVESYAAGLDPSREPVGVERTVATRTEQIAVSGRIDRLDDRPAGLDGGGVLVVVDYKTGRYVPGEDDARSSLALALYALAAERVLRRPCRRVELHHIPTGTVAAWEHTQQSLARQLSRAEDIAAECREADARFAGARSEAVVTRDQADARFAGARSEAGVTRDDGVEPDDDTFAPRPGPQCGWCDFRAHCPEGSAATQRRRPWDGLASIDSASTPDAAGAASTADAAGGAGAG